MRTRAFTPYVLLFTVLYVCATPSSFAIVIVPTDLSPGDQYRLAFVTSGQRDATSSDIADYNAFVDGFGESIIAGLDWRAIASTRAVHAHDNTDTRPTSQGGVLGVPIYHLSDARIADNYEDLWDGTLLARLEINDLGEQGSNVAWTGTTASGTGNGDRVLGGLIGLSTFGQTGFITSGLWINGASVDQTLELSLYGISPILTVPAQSVPEPATLGLAVLAATLLFARRGRKAGRRADWGHTR